MRRKRRSTPETSLNVTPLLDVVFILLIFFIVTASFIKESGIDLNRAGGGSNQAGTAGNILVSIGSSNQLWVNRRPVTPEALQPIIKQLHAEDPQAKVIVAAHPESSNGMLVRVIDSSRLAGVYEVSVAERD